jgi:hypothetical protein
LSPEAKTEQLFLIRDNYGATFVDYGRLLGILPHPDERESQTILVYDHKCGLAKVTPVVELEDALGVRDYL